MCKTPKYARQYSMLPIQGDSREMVCILQGDNIGHCEGKKLIRKRVSFWMVTEKQLSQQCAHRSLDFRLWSCMNSEVYKSKVVTRDELLASIMHAAAA
jgi:hypothetical protein